METQVFYSNSFFSGHVQGVGFRSQVVSLAKGFELTGYVKNLNDGRVELLAEGEEAEVIAFVDQIKCELDVFIKKIDNDDGFRNRQYANFVIAG